MSSKEQKTDSALLETLRRAGYKITPARVAVLETIEQEGDHLHPAEILANARRRYPALGRATVYRTLDLLTQLGIVRPIYVGEEGPTYIRSRGGHHHLVCSRCGLIQDFDTCTSDEIADELAARFNFKISSHLLEFYGLCAACRSEN